MVNPNKGGKPGELPNTDQITQMFNECNKITLSYTNGSSFVLEGAALTGFILFQKLIVGIYASAVNNATGKVEEPPVTGTINDLLKTNKNEPKKGRF